MMEIKNLANSRVKNRRASYAVVAAVAVASVAVIFSRCQGGRSSSEGIIVNEPIRGDRVCEQSEAFPYVRNSDGTIKKENEAPVKNIYYSKEDCFNGDNICDNSKEVKDPNGETVTLNKKYVDGADITLPLEDEKSPDCIFAKARSLPCGKNGEINRPLITSDILNPYLRQRTQTELEKIYSGQVTLGDNYFVTINKYEETCDKDLPNCSPEVNTKCFCENHVDCAPPPPVTCGNGKLDSGESCDLSTGRSVCAESFICLPTCRCVKKEEPKVVTPIEKEPDPVPTAEPPKPKGQCPQGLSESELVARITSNMNSNSAQIRSAAGGEGAPMTAYVTVNISGDGIPSIGGSFVKCGGSNCPAAVSPATLSNLSLGGIRVGGMAGEGCTKTYSATVK